MPRDRTVFLEVARLDTQPPGSEAFASTQRLEVKPLHQMKPLTFTARIGKTGILRTVIVPPKIVTALGGDARIPVVARYAGETTRSTIVPAGGAKRRLVLQMDVLRPAQLDAEDTIEVSLARATASHQQPLPLDFQRALQFRPTAAAELQRASPSTWRMIIERLEEARTPETRQRRIELAVERLAEMGTNRAKKAEKARERSGAP